MLPRRRLRRQAKPSAQFPPDAFGVAKGRLHAPRRGSRAGIAKLHGVTRQGLEPPP
jgi:hypothetical protein